MTKKKDKPEAAPPEKLNRLLYDMHRMPPENALKPIGGGRLKGKTDISPQWRIEALTEMFGPIGVGWTYEITSREQVHLEGTSEVALFVDIALKFKIPETGEWSGAIPGHGGSMLLVSERGGLYLDDEALKKATTDALSVACKQLGIGSDIYRGALESDSSKYAKNGRSNEERPPCPKCGKTKGVIKGKEEYGGGWVCWKKQEGCGHTWSGKEESSDKGVERAYDRAKKRKIATPDNLETRDGMVGTPEALDVFERDSAPLEVDEIIALIENTKSEQGLKMLAEEYIVELPDGANKDRLRDAWVAHRDLLREAVHA